MNYWLVTHKSYFRRPARGKICKLYQNPCATHPSTDIQSVNDSLWITEFLKWSFWDQRGGPSSIVQIFGKKKIFAGVTGGLIYPVKYNINNFLNLF